MTNVCNEEEKRANGFFVLKWPLHSLTILSPKRKTQMRINCFLLCSESFLISLKNSLFPRWISEGVLYSARKSRKWRQTAVPSPSFKIPGMKYQQQGRRWIIYWGEKQQLKITFNPIDYVTKCHGKKWTINSLSRPLDSLPHHSSSLLSPSCTFSYQKETMKQIEGPSLFIKFLFQKVLTMKNHHCQKYNLSNETNRWTGDDRYRVFQSSSFESIKQERRSKINSN